MRRHFVSGFPRALLSLSQEKSSGVEIGVTGADQKKSGHWGRDWMFVISTENSLRWFGAARVYEKGSAQECLGTLFMG